VDKKIILKRSLEKQGTSMWVGLNGLSIGSSGVLLNRAVNFMVPEKARNLLTERLLVSEGGFCYGELNKSTFLDRISYVLRIWEDSGLNLGLETGFSVRHFPWFSLGHPNK
jgi:hypothetical protein